MKKQNIYNELEKRILILDGGLGSLIQKKGLTEEDFRGDILTDWTQPLKGCNDLLALTQPEVIASIHRDYFDAGADIISTDSFNSNPISLADYGLQDWAYKISKAAAEVARKVADEYNQKEPNKTRFVTGSVGPTNRTASIAGNMEDTSIRDITFSELVSAFSTQIEGLVDGGVDIIQLETFFDTLNCKAAIFSAKQVFAKKGFSLPLIISGTLTDGGRTLSGQTVESFYHSVAHAEPLAVGFNCSFGARQLLPYLKRISDVSAYPISVYPNAGLPNLSGGYDETPQMMAADVEEYLKQGLINIVGGCCGTTPIHIAEIAKVAEKYQPRKFNTDTHLTVLSGLEPLSVSDANFTNVGERANVAGSAKFARLIREDNYDEALSIAREQVENGSTVIDICFDDGLINGPEAMTRFLNMAAAEPEIARVPFMIDSSSWEVLEKGLQCVQGKSIVNSISLKEGEQEFLRRANLVRNYGAAAVVMLFDEKGQADTYARKIEVAERAYKLLTANGFPAEDIVFDPNVLAVATGIEEHNSYGKDFIDACQWIKTNLPYANLSGGISNLSFSFRGINKVRKAMHSVFLYHAIKAGLNMAIVNPAMVEPYEDIEPELRKLVEDVILNTSPEAPERLAEYAERIKAEESQNGTATVKQDTTATWRTNPVEERIRYAMLKGIADNIEEDALEAYNRQGDVLPVIDNIFMPAMEHVGQLFGEGKMFLPQVVKTARVMKKGIGALLPILNSAEQASHGNQKQKILIATVKGDVHDIGKNIVSVVMGCNGYPIQDLGVMVECDTIVDTAVSWGADVIGLSALITPSLDEMTKVVKELERRGLQIPVIVGGATTSGVHTAVKIAPQYSGLVIHSKDASENVSILNKLFGKESNEYIAELKRQQEQLRNAHSESRSNSVIKTLSEARANKYTKPTNAVIKPLKEGLTVLNNYPIEQVEQFIDWTFFLNSWGVKGRYPEVLDSAERGEEAKKLIDDAKIFLSEIKQKSQLSLNGVVGIFPAHSVADDIVILASNGTEVTLPMLRNMTAQSGHNLSLADYVAEGGDYIGAFTLSAGIGLDKITAELRAQGDDYGAMMYKLLADRLAEAFAEVAHQEVRRNLWGYETSKELTPAEILSEKYQGRRMAFGYPACPDHSLKAEVFSLLDATANTGLRLNESYMIEPAESLCGLMFADKEINYFDVGRITEEQIADYAQRRQTTTDNIRRLLPKNI